MRVSATLLFCLVSFGCAVKQKTTRWRADCPSFLKEAIPLERIAGVVPEKGRYLAGARLPQKTLRQLAKRYNKNMPVMLDRYTRLDRVHPKPAGHLNYSVTFVGCETSEIAAANFEKLVPLYARLLCSKKESRRALAHTKGFVYTFKGRDGERAGSLKVTRRDCK